MGSSFFHAHAHSRFSWLDGMTDVNDMVLRAAKFNQPGLAITDHGVMSGSVALYKSCQREGLAPFPGVEAYLTTSLDKDAKRHHCCILALDAKGYEGLVKLSTKSHTGERFYKKPRLTLADLKLFGKTYGRNVAITTGCYFGLVVQALVNDGPAAAKSAVKTFAGMFPNTYVELQHHNTIQPDGSTDYDLCVALFDIANELGLPVIVTNDCHYLNSDEKSAHEMMKKLGYRVSDDSEVLFPGDLYHLASTPWMKKHYLGLKAAWEAAEDGFDDLLTKNRMSLPALDKFQFHVPTISRDADKRLADITRSGLHVRGVDVFDPYLKRAQYELGIIKDMGFANYFLLVADVVRWCTSKGILVNTRGSANGSLICYATGITQADPVEWEISFDRFLHPSRQKPPDIDLDIDRDARDLVIEHMASSYKVVPIGTFGRLTDTEDRGSIFQKYLGWKRDQLGDAYKTSPFARIDKLRDLEQIAPDDMVPLRKLADMDVLTGGGTHAAGFIIETEEQPIGKYVPLMRVGGQKGHLVSQFDDDGVEDFGYVKFDALGMAALTTVKRCLELVGKDPRNGLTWIPNDDPGALKLMAEGRTGTGIFQFEGYSTAMGAKEMKLRNTKDCILCLALYRPASLSTGNTADYLARRQKKKPWTHLHPVFEKETKDTYGMFVLQDQVIGVLRGLGMDYSDLNLMLKAVKASNHNTVWAASVFEDTRKKFFDLCKKIGMDDTRTKRGWAMVRGFSDYGFNKAHATSYGLLAYRMAFLKSRHPSQFMAACLETWAGTPKEAKYLGEARRLGIKIAKVDINKSGVRWVLDDKGFLRRGFLSIKGVGEPSAEVLVANQPYTSVQDIIDKCGTKPVTGGQTYAKTGTLNGVLGKLNDIGALKSLELTREE